MNFKVIQLLLILLVPAAMLAQDDGLQRHVVRKWKDGTPYVVIYTKPGASNRLKEEVFYKNGQLDYVGHYRNGTEHGEWKYFYEDGTIKSIEYYQKGLENGTMYDYNEQGKPIKEYVYVKGTLITEKELAVD